MYKKVGSIYSTENYDMFQKLNGNRAVLDARKALIISSIKDRGYIRNPIVVNEKMEIIDGQGRFEALKELGMPIEYVFAKGATIADCIALNVKQKNWNLRDYARCYADIGNPDYVLFASLFGKYENIGDAALPTIVGTRTTDASASNLIRNGTFEIYDAKTLMDRLDFANKCLGIIGNQNGTSRRWIAAIKFFYFFDKVDNELFLKKLEKYRTLIYPVVKVQQAVDCLGKIYNYARKTEKVYFAEEFDKWRKEINEQYGVAE